MPHCDLIWEMSVKWKGYVSDNMKLDINVKGFSAIGDLLSLSWEAIYGKQIDGGVSGAWLQAWLNFLLSRGKAVVYESI